MDQEQLYVCGMKVDSERLKSARLARGLTQRQVADVAGVSVQAVSQWENGRSEPEFSRLNVISNILGVNYQWLISETNNPGKSLVSKYVETGKVPIINAADALKFHNFGVQTNVLTKPIGYITPTVKILGQGFAIIAEQVGMKPSINDGDILLFDTGITAIPGDIILAMLYFDMFSPVIREFIQPLTEEITTEVGNFNNVAVRLHSHESSDWDIILGLGSDQQLGQIVAPLVELRRYRDPAKALSSDA